MMAQKPGTSSVLGAWLVLFLFVHILVAQDWPRSRRTGLRLNGETELANHCMRHHPGPDLVSLVVIAQPGC
jgi:hypothetical protein